MTILKDTAEKIEASAYRATWNQLNANLRFYCEHGIQITMKNRGYQESRELAEAKGLNLEIVTEFTF